MKQRAVAIIADYLSQRPLGRVVGPGDLEPWLKSFKTGECVQPASGLCGRCNASHSDRHVDGEVFGNCIPCQAELVEVALELGDEQEAE